MEMLIITRGPFRNARYTLNGELTTVGRDPENTICVPGTLVSRFHVRFDRNADGIMLAEKKAFNIREGWRPEDDTLPERFLSEGLTEGASRGAVIPRERLQRMIRAYNVARGWTEEGYLPDRRMIDLGVEPR